MMMFPLGLMALPAMAETAPGDPVLGAASYARSCARCHGPGEVLAAILPGETPDEKALMLEMFLATHRAPNPQMRADIIVWLLSF
ncbi:hypothetical protein [Actibacterium sp. D379-3]